MKTIVNYERLIEKACRIALDNFTSDNSVKKITADKDALLGEIQNDSYIKVPFVGDFSAGKSSLINSYMGVNLLPTDVAPQTAVSYELYYSENESLKVYHNGSLKIKLRLEDISTLDVVPGDIVKVYIKNDNIKKLNDKNIVIVDMPGIDSGIEAHNNAILNYIAEGTHFIIVMECTGGSFRNSTISFINEIKKYGLSLSVLLSKADKLPEKELHDNRTYIESQAKAIIGDYISVGVTSAVANMHSDLDSIFDTINADDYIALKYKSKVVAFVNEVISELKLQTQLLLSNKENLSQRIEQIKTEKEIALKELESKDNESQSVPLSADDILNDVREALLAKSDYLATIVLNSKNDQKLFTDEVMHIIRPVLMESFKREISEYQDCISSSIKDFSVKVESVINDSDNILLNGANQIYEKLTNRESIESLAKAGLDKLSVLLVNYKSFSVLLKTLGKVLGPILTIALNFLPDLIKMFLGTSDAKKKAEIADKLKSEAIPGILDAMRDDIEKMLSEQRANAKAKMQEIIDTESKKYDDNIKEMIANNQTNEQDRNEKIEHLTSYVDNLVLDINNL